MPNNLSGVFQVVPVNLNTGPFKSKAVSEELTLKDGKLVLKSN